MKDKTKVVTINNLANRIITNTNRGDNDGSYYDYDAVIGLLERAIETITESTRCPRPDNIPEDIPWCEGTDEEFDLERYKIRLEQLNTEIELFKETGRIYSGTAEELHDYEEKVAEASRLASKLATKK